MPEATDYKRDLLDRFFTPPALARVFAEQAIRLVDRTRVPLFIEPSCGAGALSSAVAQVAGEQHVKIDFTCLVDVEHALTQIPDQLGSVKIVNADWLSVAPGFKGGAQLIVSNPPFAVTVPGKKEGSVKRLAIIQKHVEAMHVALAEGGLLGVLSRQSFLGQPRDEWMSTSARPFLIQQLLPRPSFTENGRADNAEYVLVWWEKFEGSVHSPKTSFEWLRWRPKTERKKRKP